MTKIPNPAQVVTTTFGGKTFRAGRRTAAHLAFTQERLTKAHPGARLLVIQPCYNVGVAASAGTHDKDGVLDVWIDGLSWEDAQHFLRSCGWAAWWRHTGSWADPSQWHIHMVSLGCPGPVGIFVPGQVADYLAHRSGLAGHVHDATWHPADLNATFFDYPAYVLKHTLPVVSLKRVREAAKTPVWRLVLAPKVLADRKIVRRALTAAKCDTFRQWQLRLGFTGDDANGVPGRTSLEALGERHGFRVVK